MVGLPLFAKAETESTIVVGIPFLSKVKAETTLVVGLLLRQGIGRVHACGRSTVNHDSALSHIPFFSIILDRAHACGRSIVVHPIPHLTRHDGSIKDRS